MRRLRITIASLLVFMLVGCALLSVRYSLARANEAWQEVQGKVVIAHATKAISDEEMKAFIAADRVFQEKYKLALEKLKTGDLGKGDYDYLWELIEAWQRKVKR